MADKAHEQTDELLSAMEDHLYEIYEEAYQDVQRKVDKYFAAYREKDGAKRELVEKGMISPEEYAAWRQGQMARGRHWEHLVYDFATELKNVNKTALAYINGRLPEVYAINYNGLAEVFDGLVRGYTWELVNADVIRNLATRDQTLLPYKYLDGKKDVRWNTKVINSQVMQGILQGESIPKIAKRMQNVTEMNRKSAVRNARTTVTSAENKGRQDGYERAASDGIRMQREWIAAIDGRTRHAHRLLDGQLAEVDKPFKSEYGDIMYPGDPGAHPANVYNCRCTLGVKVLGFDRIKALTMSGNRSIISVKEMYYKRSLEQDRVPISDRRFSELTIQARKNGASIIRCSPEDVLYQHLKNNGATAACIGDTLVFMPDVTVSEVLEETRHFFQNKNLVNADKPLHIAQIMNEIEAKEYIIKHAKKYAVPRTEIEHLQKQIESYQTELKKINGEG